VKDIAADIIWRAKRQSLAMTIIQLIARGIQVDTSMLIIDVWKGDALVVPLTPAPLIVSVVVRA